MWIWQHRQTSKIQLGKGKTSLNISFLSISLILIAMNFFYFGFHIISLQLALIFGSRGGLMVIIGYLKSDEGCHK